MSCNRSFSGRRRQAANRPRVPVRKIRRAIAVRLDSTNPRLKDGNIPSVARIERRLDPVLGRRSEVVAIDSGRTGTVTMQLVVGQFEVCEG
jgi:hypothetical protein